LRSSNKGPTWAPCPNALKESSHSRCRPPFPRVPSWNGLEGLTMSGRRVGVHLVGGLLAGTARGAPAASATPDQAAQGEVQALRTACAEPAGPSAGPRWQGGAGPSAGWWTAPAGGTPCAPRRRLRPRRCGWRAGRRGPWACWRRRDGTSGRAEATPAAFPLTGGGRRQNTQLPAG
jgi:hypothetical protein